jgi:hypothetical protein
MKGKAHPENVAVDCRRDVQVNLGLRLPKPFDAEPGVGF